MSAFLDKTLEASDSLKRSSNLAKLHSLEATWNQLLRVVKVNSGVSC